MPRFTYTAFDVHGSDRSGAIDAPTAERAIGELKAMGMFPVRLAAAAGGADAAGAGTRRRAPAARRTLAMRFPGQTGISRKERAVFTRQLATLVRAGMPLVRGLDVLVRQERNPTLATVICGLAEHIRGGGALSDALEQQPQVFDRLFVNMVRAGEAGGMLGPVLERLAGFQEKSLQLRGKVRAAMVYPLIVLGVAVTILTGLLVFVVPRFQQIFADLLKGAPLPPLTQAVLGLSSLVRAHSLALSAGVVAVVLAGRLAGRSPTAVRLIDAAVLRLPWFGDLVLKAVVARTSRTLGTLLASGVPILVALRMTGDTCGSARVAGAFAEAHDRVKEGGGLAPALERTAVLPAMVSGLIDVGEHTGKLAEMLGRIADIYDDEVDHAVAGLNALIEPVLIVFLAVVVGTIVIALFLPIIRIVQLMT